MSTWVKVFSIDTEFSIGKIFPQCIGIGKPSFSVLEKWLFSIEIFFWNFHPCVNMKYKTKRQESHERIGLEMFIQSVNASYIVELFYEPQHQKTNRLHM